MKPSERISELAEQDGTQVDGFLVSTVQLEHVIAFLDEQLASGGMIENGEARMQTDDAFCMVVKMLEHAAVEHGFTPAELKQAAFTAAIRVEMRATKAQRGRL